MGSRVESAEGGRERGQGRGEPANGASETPAAGLELPALPDLRNRELIHDLNNLLGTVINYAHFVEEEVRAAAGGDLGRPWASVLSDVEQVRRAARRAAELLRPSPQDARDADG